MNNHLPVLSDLSGFAPTFDQLFTNHLGAVIQQQMRTAPVALLLALMGAPAAARLANPEMQKEQLDAKAQVKHHHFAALLLFRLRLVDTTPPFGSAGALSQQEKDAKYYRKIKGYEELAKAHHKNQSSMDCGDCGVSYQACCLAFQLEGDPCDCHLDSPGSGVVGPNCGDCGVEYGACCIGFDQAGYPCNCDIFP